MPPHRNAPEDHRGRRQRDRKDHALQPDRRADGIPAGGDRQPAPRSQVDTPRVVRRRRRAVHPPDPSGSSSCNTARSGPLLLERADTLLWLDYPTSVQMTRLMRRTLRRRLLRQELWNGNQEPPLRTFFTDEEHIMRWGWRTRNEPADHSHRGRPFPVIDHCASGPSSRSRTVAQSPGRGAPDDEGASGEARFLHRRPVHAA